MIRTIADKEFTEFRRDGRFRLAASLMLVLLIAGSLLGWRNYLDLQAQAEEAAEHDYKRWQQQDPKHPHDAAHNGVYVFKTPRPLAMVDGGIEPYVGASIMNGAHIQGEAEFPPAQDMTALQRFGDLSPALAGQVLLPLLVILLSFATFAGEREQGTMRQLLSIGVKPSWFLWGKAVGIVVALASVLLPVAIVGIGIAAYLAAPESRLDETLRAGLLVLVYGLYLLIMLFMSLGVSACCRSARTALVILLVFWGVTVFAIPRALLDVSGRFYPTPVNVEFWGKLSDDLWREWGEGADAFKKKLLAEYQVEKVEDLPFDYTGQDMQNGDETAWRVYERYDRQRYDIYDQQSRFLEWGSIIAPAAGVSLLSMALTGNDLPQYRDFTRQVEEHRRTMNTLLNDYISAHQQKTANGWDNSAGVKGDSALWQSIPAFVYRPPSGWTALRPYPVVIVILTLWLIAAFGFARFAVARLSGH
ncbi:DUF3526 domain-containing protein [Methylomonas sp. AM2-LC]|uniref:DUF3526 domain-containing protein n=1 Tax=Methylomonas sp. AM2-LC TaxID=3153301 RepID=UPI0032675141